MSRADVSKTLRRALPPGSKAARRILPGLPGSCFALALLFAPGFVPEAAAQGGEAGRICEVNPVMRCLDKERIEGATLKVPLDAAAIRKDGFRICDSSFNYTTSPDIVLIMDNTGSMDSLTTIDGIPRWCNTPNNIPEDPGCISGDPHSQRGPALRTFLDSALVKGGKGINVGIVSFSVTAEATSEKLLPLTAESVDSIKATIVMEKLYGTNYTVAFTAAINLLKSSRKPKSEQFIIFVSDGRPSDPPPEKGDRYAYKTFWDQLPAVHSIFLGDNAANYKDMQDISDKTGGLFFNIKDVYQLANILTDDLAKQLFRRAAPTLTTVRNLSVPDRVFRIPAADHEPEPDSGAYTLSMPGPLELAKGVNDIVVKTEYGYGGATQDVHFKIERSGTGPYFEGLEESCRGLPELILYNAKDEALNLLGRPYAIDDSVMRYSLTTSADLDSFEISLETRSSLTSQKDEEAAPNNASNREDSTWSGTMPFRHQTVRKDPGDGLLQVEHGETLVASYRNPYIREDSITVKVKLRYGPEFGEAAYRDLDGDGRIETVTIHYRENLGALPAKLQFKIIDAAGASAERTALASAGEIRFPDDASGSRDAASLVVTLDNPFPFGMTSVANPDSSGRTFRQTDIPMVDGFFRVDDSVPPVILRAEVAKEKSDGRIQVLVTYSEPVRLAEPSLEPLVFKRDTVVFTAREIAVSGIEKTGDMTYRFNLAEGGSFKPVGGDSLAINNNGETADLSGVTPRERVFTPMGGAAPGQTISDLYVTFANGSLSKAKGAKESPDGRVLFIPVDSKGYPVPGDENGKCGRCSPLQGDLFSGSVIHLVTKQPVRYEFAIFSNLGELVARGSGAVEEEDLRLLDKIEDPGKDPNQTEYVQRIVWTGRTRTGEMVGTGAFVLRAVFHYDRNFKTGARPSTATRVSKFGFLRACCASESKGWFE